jgi:hypothetical protein
MYANYDYGGSAYPYADPYRQPTVPSAHHQATPFPGYGGTTLSPADPYAHPTWGASGHANSVPLGRPKRHRNSDSHSPTKAFYRSQTSGHKVPLKSAMKKSVDGAIPLARVRTTSESRQSFSSVRSRQLPFVSGISVRFGPFFMLPTVSVL